MQRVTGPALRRLLRTIAAIGDLDDLRSFRERVAGLVEELIPADVTSYNEIDLRNRRVAVLTASDTDSLARLHEAFARHAHENPLVARAQRHPGAPPARISDLIPHAHFRRLEVYDQVHRPLGVEHQLAVSLPPTGGRVVGLALNRGGADFDEEDRALLALLAPHLRSTYRHLRTRDLLERALRAAEWGTGARRGVLLIGSGGQLEGATAAAVEILDISDAGALPEPLHRWARDRERRRTPLILTVGGRALAARWLPARDAWGPDAVIVTAAEPSERAAGPDSPPSPERMAQLGLTPREGEVLARVAIGDSNVQAARALGVSPRTVEKHLERIYAKLGVASRTQALARLRATFDG